MGRSGLGPAARVGERGERTRRQPQDPEGPRAKSFREWLLRDPGRKRLVRRRRRFAKEAYTGLAVVLGCVALVRISIGMSRFFGF